MSRRPLPLPPPPPPALSSSHSSFFSSLKQVEKRLKLDSIIHSSSQQSSSPPNQPPLPPRQPQPQSDSIYTASQSLGSAIHLNFDRPTTTNSSTFQDSEPPREFLSNNPLDFPPTNPDPPQSNTPEHPQTTNSVVNTGIDNIDMLMKLLDLSSPSKEEPVRICLGLNCIADGRSSNCGCGHDGFYTKIVGARGPKCGKELERLNGWIKHFLDRDSNGNERRESFRLAHLLLAKAAFLSQESGEFECFDLPSTIDDFLRNNPL